MWMMSHQPGARFLPPFMSKPPDAIPLSTGKKHIQESTNVTNTHVTNSFTTVQKKISLQ